MHIWETFLKTLREAFLCDISLSKTYGAYIGNPETGKHVAWCSDIVMVVFLEQINFYTNHAFVIQL